MYFYKLQNSLGETHSYGGRIRVCLMHGHADTHRQGALRRTPALSNTKPPITGGCPDYTDGALIEEHVRFPFEWGCALRVRPVPNNMTREDYNGRD